MVRKRWVRWVKFAPRRERFLHHFAHLGVPRWYVADGRLLMTCVVCRTNNL